MLCGRREALLQEDMSWRQAEPELAGSSECDMLQPSLEKSAEPIGSERESTTMTIGRLIEGRAAAVVTCSTDMPVRDAIALLADRRIGALPVTQGGALAGIFSERDVIYGLREVGDEVLAQTVGEVMTAPAVTADPSTSVLAALSLMTQRRIRHLPVMSGDRMIGFVSIGDLVKHRIDQIQSEAEAMRAYIQSA